MPGERLYRRLALCCAVVVLHLPALPATAAAYSPVARWVHAQATPHQPDDHRFRLRTTQWVEIRATTDFVLLDGHLRSMERSRTRESAGFRNPSFRVHRRLAAGDYVVRVQLPENVTVRIPYDLRFGPLRETVVMSSSTWAEGVDGTPTVSGEIINETASARTGIKVRATYLSDDGTALTNRTVPLLQRVVASRASAMFLVGREAPPGTRRVRVAVVDAGRATQAPDPVVTASPYDDYECAPPPEEHCWWNGVRLTVTVRGSRPADDVIAAWASMDAHGRVSHIQHERLGTLAPGTYDQAIGGVDADIVAEAGPASG